MHALKVWACRSVTPTELVYLVMVVGTKSGRTELRSLGQSQFGNLGQGLDIKTSHTFKPVDLGGHELRSKEDVYIGLDNTFAVTKNGALYGWGSYSPDDKPVFKPSQVKYFDKYNIIKIAGGSRTYALVSPKDQPEK
jgi:alpha-tubulin suppressor-like RCC1 family protein